MTLDPPLNPPGGEVDASIRPLWQRAVALVIAPRSVFEELANRPAWVFTALALSVIPLLATLVIYDSVLYPYAVDQIQDQDLTSEQRDGALAFYEGAAAPWLFGLIGSLFRMLQIAVSGFLLYAAGSFFLGGRGTVRQGHSIAAHALLVLALQTLILIPIMIARSDPTLSVGPGVFLPASEASGFGETFLAGILGGLDFFNLWAVALSALGVAVVFRVSQKGAAIVVAAGYALIVVVWSGVAALAAG